MLTDYKVTTTKSGAKRYYKRYFGGNWVRLNKNAWHYETYELERQKQEEAIRKAPRKLSPEAAAEMPGRIDKEIRKAYGSSQSPLVNAIRRGDPVPVPMPQSHFTSPDESDFEPSETLGSSLGLGLAQPFDPVNHPPHYTSHPSGIECIKITEHLNFCLGNAMKYLWRAGLKGGHEDLLKAIWYIKREINRTGGAV